MASTGVLAAHLRRDVGRSVKRRMLRAAAQGRMLHPPFGHVLNDRLAERPDYARYAALALAARRVETEGIPGAFAEVGVWRGDASEVIHRCAPDRRFYLFDTFQGFPQSDLNGEDDARFRDTSVGYVRGRLGDAPTLRLRPGRVPATFRGLEDERFAFVLCDLDLHAPTVATLAFMYPRLEPGGFLLVHDYNNPESDWACKRALDAFLADKPERLVELPDAWGTAVLRRC